MAAVAPLLILNATSSRVLTSSIIETPPAYLKILQVFTATSSFVASTIIVFSITCCGTTGLSTPYRRIIFGLSVADILQSLALLVGPSSVSPELLGEPDAEGMACKVNGFIILLGGLTVMMYTFFLCLYYVCKLKYKMSDNAFRHRIEQKLHAFFVVISFTASSAAVAMDTMHTNGTFFSFCNLGPSPTLCDRHPDIVGECDPIIMRRADIFIIVLNVVLPAICFVGITVTMGLLYQHAYDLNQTIEREVSTPTALRSGISKEEEGESKILTKDKVTPAADVEKETPQERVQHLSRLYRREITIQATSYVFAFLFTYVPLIVAMALITAGFYSPVLDPIVIFTYPFGGFLNIIIYTRPKVASLRRDYPGCSRLRGFWFVLKAGGEIPEEVDLSLSCCQDCCRAPAWLDSEYETTSVKYDRPTDAPKSIHLSRIGF